jgi:hypothetical protein
LTEKDIFRTATKHFRKLHEQLPKEGNVLVKMHDNWLITFAMSVAALGMAGLLVALMLLQPQGKTLAQAQEEMDGTPLSVHGKIVSTRGFGDKTIVTISAVEQIDVLVEGNISFNKSDCIIAAGKKGNYKDRVQISASIVARC